MSHDHTRLTNAEIEMEFRFEQELRGEYDFGLLDHIEEQQFEFTDDDAAAWDRFNERIEAKADLEWFAHGED